MTTGPAPTLAELTTLRVGGAVERLLQPETEDALVAAFRALWADDEPWLLLGGGSNTLAGDDGFAGTVVRVRTRGIERIPSVQAGIVRLRVQAGESWDGLVASAVDQGLAGLEALSGIPGSCGASPVQNIGAYGQELSATLAAVSFLDEATGVLERVPAADLALGYRTSVFKQGRAGVVTAIEVDLLDASADGLSRPVAYPQLAQALGVGLGERMPLRTVRDAVLALRSAKGMVLDPDDVDSVSAGSFFTNPVVSAEFAATLPLNAPRWPVQPVEEAPRVTSLDAVAAGHPVAVPAVSGEAPDVKLSAAWLIEHSGISRGFRLHGSRAGISEKHTLALTNRGGARAEEIAELARYVQGRVVAEFGVLLHPEPVLVGIEL